MAHPSACLCMKDFGKCPACLVIDIGYCLAFTGNILLKIALLVSSNLAIVRVPRVKSRL